MKGMVSKSKFQEILFLRPSAHEQSQFGGFFQKAMNLTEGLRKSLVESEALSGGLEVRAFRGEL